MDKDIRWKLKTSLEARGFKPYESRISFDSFGDLYDIYSNLIIDIRLVKDRGAYSIDFRKTGTEEWFDIDVIAALIYPARDYLVKRVPDNNLDSFILETLDPIINLFSDFSYSKTKMLLNDLRHKRAKELFD